MNSDPNLNFNPNPNLNLNVYTWENVVSKLNIELTNLSS